MRVLGDIFGQREKALKLFDYLDATEKMIRKRTASIKEKNKVSMLYLGLNPNVRKKGAAGSVSGVNTPELYIIEGIANAKNAFTGKG